MIFTVLTLFPEMFHGFLNSSIVRRSIDAGLNRVELINFREFTEDKHNNCDDAPYGGGAGMLIKPEPLARALDDRNAKAGRTVYLTPSGTPLTQRIVESLALEEEIIVICGHYEGIDQRIIDEYVSDEISIGDYVLSAGEVAARVLIDGIARLTEGVIKPDSLVEESFCCGLLEYPQFTRPEVFQDRRVPEVLLSGNHEKIRRWRLKESLRKTRRVRPELIEGSLLSDEMKILLKEIIEEEKNGSN